MFSKWFETIILIGVMVLAVQPLAAQQLNKPHPIEPFKSVGSSSNQLGNDVSVRSNSMAVPLKGLATDVKKPTQPRSVTPKAPLKPTHVVDRQGKWMQGAVQVEKNRVMDPKTGRVYTTVPDGSSQRIIDGQP